MVTYRLATKEDYENINNFHNKIYKKNRTIEQFYWEFHNCPFGKSIYVVACVNNQIVGTNCVIPIVLTNAKRELILTGKSEDTLVDPEFRGHNIFNNIYDCLFEECIKNGIKIIWGFTSAKKPFLKVGFQVPFEHIQSLSVNKTIESYKYLTSLNKNNTIIQKLKILGLCILSKLKGLKNNFKANISDLIIKEKTEIYENINTLIESCSKEYPNLFYILQSNDFQKWRVYENPNYYKVHTYSVYDTKNSLVALVVLNTHPNGVAYIIQSTFSSNISKNQKHNVIKNITLSMFKKDTTIIRNWHFDTNIINKEEIEIFNKSNYIILKKGIGFVWKDLDSTGLDPKNFLLSRISTEGIL